jgi:hypothetical protein
VCDACGDADKYVQQYGLPAWGASGPYLKVYEKFGITGTSTYIDLHVGDSD